ncbi:hypothetical protein FHS78_003683 [Parvibaculum indicum]|jgi:hypothetical protein|uniref:hypothetical protein n=1 Tax=Parvibaculum TaxID=256616 RepID=UPI000C9086E2|nr:MULTISPECIES: hypothetical protein [Parvibaculum]MAB14734.1 hypothetical protein [Parvibaculum sp.]NIJ43368.1 hypothetical protein [Parvibaculum indicum]
MNDDDVIVLSFGLDRHRVGRAFFAEDDIGAIVRCHFETERAVDHALKKFTDGRFKSDGSRGFRNFGDKIEVLRLLGVGDNLLSPLRRHNDHRNQFAHRGQDELTVEQVSDLHRMINALIPDYGKMKFTFKGNRNFESLYSELTLRQKYVANMMALINLVAALPEVAKRNKDNLKDS